MRSAWNSTVGPGGGPRAFGWWFLWLLEVVFETIRGNPGIVFNLPRPIAEAVFPMMSYSVFITAGAYLLLYHIVRRVNERL